MKKVVIFVVLGLAIGWYFAQKFHEVPQVVDIQEDISGGSSEVFPFLTITEAKETINREQMKEILWFLASDELEGRMSGKKGNITAAEFIFGKFKSFGLKPQYQKFKIRRLNSGPKNEHGNDYTSNIIGILEGKTNQAIIIGAHMDHIGYGPSMSRDPHRREIHNGADDNASGSTIVLELAKAFSQMKKPRHTLIFICFSAEEMGLIGSKYYVAHPIFSLDDTVLMVNFDMVGYWRNSRFLSAYGAFQIPLITEIVRDLESKYPFRVDGTSGSGGSDHAVFGNRGIPYVFFHTGLHPYYHTPDDDAYRIDYSGLNLVAKFAFEMIYEYDQKTSDGKKVSLDKGLHLDEIHDHGIHKF